jgi:hypothetical protein
MSFCVYSLDVRSRFLRACICGYPHVITLLVIRVDSIVPQFFIKHFHAEDLISNCTNSY